MKTKPFLLGLFLFGGLVATQAAQFENFTYESFGGTVTIMGYTGGGVTSGIFCTLPSAPW